MGSLKWLKEKNNVVTIWSCNLLVPLIPVQVQFCIIFFHVVVIYFYTHWDDGSYKCSSCQLASHGFEFHKWGLDFPIPSRLVSIESLLSYIFSLSSDLLSHMHQVKRKAYTVCWIYCKFFSYSRLLSILLSLLII